MNRRNIRRLMICLAVIVLFLLYLAAAARPSFTPAMALERAQRWYGSSFTGEVYEAPVDDRTVVYLGEMGSGYGLISVESYGAIFPEKPGNLYRCQSFYWIDDMEDMPVSSVQMWRETGSDSPERYASSSQFSNYDPGFFFARVSDPEVVRVEVRWRNLWVPEDGEHTVSFTEFYDGMFFFPLGSRDIMGRPCDYILSAYDAAGELVFRDTCGDWDGVTHGDTGHTYYFRP